MKHDEKFRKELTQIVEFLGGDHSPARERNYEKWELFLWSDKKRNTIMLDSYDNYFPHFHSSFDWFFKFYKVLKNFSGIVGGQDIIKKIDNSILDYDIESCYKYSIEYLDWAHEEGHLTAGKEKSHDRKKTQEINYLGFVIKNTGNSDGNVLYKESDKYWQSHLGNYNKVIDAKRAALFYYLLDDLDKFHKIIAARFLYGSSIHMEGSTLTKKIKSDGYELPKEITFSNDSNKTILFNGKSLDYADKKS